MKIHFDPETDALYLTFSDQAIVETDEVRPGVMFDLDASGRVVAIEVLKASQTLADTDLNTLVPQVA
ncbi:MAG: DUF2283 domain-containing protein [Rhizomicrobium sp.]